MPASKVGNSSETAGANREEGGDDVKSSRPLRSGLHTCYNGRYRKQPLCEKELIFKAGLSSDRSLQLDCVKLESLVIADQHAAVNTFPGLVHTARHTMGADKGRSRRANLREADAQAVVDDWGEVVTR